MIARRGALLIAFVALVGAWEAFGALSPGCEARKGCAWQTSSSVPTTAPVTTSGRSPGGRRSFSTGSRRVEP